MTVDILQDLCIGLLLLTIVLIDLMTWRLHKAVQALYDLISRSKG